MLDEIRTSSLASNPLFALGVLLVAYAVKRLYLDYYLFSPLRKIPGPPRWSALFGDLRHLLQNTNPIETFDSWREHHGSVARYSGIGGETRLFICDETAMKHILNDKAYQYPKPDFIRRELEMFLGVGILTSEGAQHKRQKRLLGPVFTQYNTGRYGSMIVDTASHFAKTLRKLAKDGPVETVR
jgi:cytochrome P450